MKKTIHKVILIHIPLFLLIGLFHVKLLIADKILDSNSSELNVIMNTNDGINEGIDIIEIKETVEKSITVNNTSTGEIIVLDTPDKIIYKNDIEISFLGDVMIGGRVKDAINKHGESYAFSGTSNYLSKQDAVIFNLETPITDTGKKFNKKYVFKANKEHLQGLKTFNDNLYANLANNHFGDYGEEGMNNTFQNLNDNGIEYFGAGNNKTEANTVKVIEVEDVKIGLIAQTCVNPFSFGATENKPGNSRFNKDILKQEIISARNLGTDIIIYNMHCGTEYTNGPNSEQTEYAHFAIDNGADLVIGHHPHWYQPIEIYNDKLIFYSLGDYIFDIFRGRRTQEGIIANIKISDKKIVGAEIIPTYTEGYGNTVFSSESKRDFALNELYEISKKLGEIEGIKEGYIDLK